MSAHSAHPGETEMRSLLSAPGLPSLWQSVAWVSMAAGTPALRCGTFRRMGDLSTSRWLRPPPSAAPRHWSISALLWMVPLQGVHRGDDAVRRSARGMSFTDTSWPPFSRPPPTPGSANQATDWAPTPTPAHTDLNLADAALISCFLYHTDVPGGS